MVKRERKKFSEKVHVNLDRDPKFFADIYVTADKDTVGQWYIPGTFESPTNDYCGSFKAVSLCEDHPQATKVHSRACKILGCPKCFSTGIADRASRIENKLFEYYKLTSRILKHFVLSENLRTGLKPADYDFLEHKKIAMDILKQFTDGGVLFFHPFRFDKVEKTLEFSPHWHIIASAKEFEWTNKHTEKYGCVLWNKGWRDFAETKDFPVFGIWKKVGRDLVKTKPYLLGQGKGCSPIFRNILYILSHTGLTQENYIVKKKYTVSTKLLLSKKKRAQFKSIDLSSSNCVNMAEAVSLADFRKIKRKMVSTRQSNCYFYYKDLSTSNMQLDSIEKRNVPVKCPLCNKTMKITEFDLEVTKHYVEGLERDIKDDLGKSVDQVIEGSSITKINYQDMVDNNILYDHIMEKKIKHYKIRALTPSTSEKECREVAVDSLFQKV